MNRSVDTSDTETHKKTTTDNNGMEQMYPGQKPPMSTQLHDVLIRAQSFPIGVAFDWSDQFSTLCIGKWLPVAMGKGVVEASDRLIIGDWLVALNNVDLAFETREQTLEHLRKTPLPWDMLFKHHINKSRSSEVILDISDGVSESKGTTLTLSESKGTTNHNTNRLSKNDTKTLIDNTQIKVLKNHPYSFNVRRSKTGRLLIDLRKEIENTITNVIPQIEYIKVENQSYYEMNRSRIGNNKMRYRGVIQNKTTQRWEGRIWSCPNSGGEFVERFVGSYTSEVECYRACEKAAKARDKPPQDSDPVYHKATAFNIHLVSDFFSYRNYYDRCEIVFNELMKQVWKVKAYPRKPKTMKNKKIKVTHQDLSMLQCSSWRKFGIVGSNVRNLPHFRNFGFTLSLKLQTKAEWKPRKYGNLIEHHLGKSHLEEGKLESVKGKIGKKELLALMDPEALREIEVQEELTREVSSRSGTATSSQLYKQVSRHGSTVTNSENNSENSKVGVFYHSLSKVAKDLISKQLKQQKILLHKSRRVKKAQSIFEAKRPTTSNENTTRGRNAINEYENMSKSDRQYILAAKSLQHLFRRRQSHVQVRKWLVRNRHTLTIQRVYRAYKARVFFKHYRYLKIKAAVMFSSTYRSKQSRKQAKALLLAFFKAVLFIQPMIRGRLTRKWLEREKIYGRAARTIQRYVRGYRGRNETKRVIARRYFDVFIYPSVCIIQKAWRSYLGWIALKRMAKQAYHCKKEMPAIKLLQKVYRSYLGRKRIAMLKYVAKNASLISRLFHGYLGRRKARKVRRKQLEEVTATRLQAMARCYIAKCLRFQRYQYRRHHHVVLPAVLHVQAKYRSYLTRKIIRDTIHKNIAATKMQGLWRQILAKRTMIKLWEKMALQHKGLAAASLQALYRGWVARRDFFVKIRVSRGLASQAAMTLQRGIRCMYARRAVKEKRFLQERKWGLRVLRECTEDGQEIRDECVDLEEDLKYARRVKRRVERQISSLRKHRRTMQQRIPDVEDEIDKLTDEDIERGWMEALEREWEQLQNRAAMSAEELLSKRFQLRNFEEQIEIWMLQVEELEMDLDECEMQYVRETEMLRLSEITKVEYRVSQEWDRRVRTQQVRWGVQDQDLRKATIKRHLTKLGKYIKPSPNRDPDIKMPSVSTKDIIARKMILERWQKLMSARKQALNWKLKLQRGEKNPKWREEFNRTDQVMKETLNHGVHAWSLKLHEGAARKKQPMCLLCGKVRCKCNFVSHTQSKF